jgi:pSer/pThr/pTyr-binding forkhead associated (FHA) protein
VPAGICRRCGELLNAHANFCWFCGAAQSDDPSPTTQAVPVVSVDQPVAAEAATDPDRDRDVLVIGSGGVTGTRLELEHNVTTFGRSRDSGIVLDDVSVSRHHGVFTRTASGRVNVRDLNSLNGTYVNGVRVDETTLRNGDELRIGKFKLIFWGATA